VPSSPSGAKSSGRREVAVVERQRAAGLGVAGERDEADRVVEPALQLLAAEHEPLEHLLHGIEPRELAILLG
jgi:hypothetical protein